MLFLILLLWWRLIWFFELVLFFLCTSTGSVFSSANAFCCVGFGGKSIYVSSWGNYLCTNSSMLAPSFFCPFFVFLSFLCGCKVHDSIIVSVIWLCCFLHLFAFQSSKAERHRGILVLYKVPWKYPWQASSHLSGRYLHSLLWRFSSMAVAELLFKMFHRDEYQLLSCRSKDQ